MVLAFSGLIFETQFIEISTQLTCNDDPNPIVYGLGERLWLAHLRADDEGDLYPMFSRAPNTSAPVHTRGGGDNLYSVHPFILQLENGETGNAHVHKTLLSNTQMLLVVQLCHLTGPWAIKLASAEENQLMMR
ncbi:hypothetical protein PsorP6_001107 [Peronosclerospora sorghi]|uniref:Uncharacterized protein n=1 Tax=Peronosclerospora sorghi TaxID=230839 RepID=A0ACC0WR21_9STRA|nr:hypothetical protein PsorP6_001107 [Peronosclerospora sorghi]